MRHNISGKQLGRDKDARKLLFRNLVGELVVHGRIKTTQARAKAIRPLVDKLVTKARKATLEGKREILGFLPKEAAQIFIDTVVPRFADRTSGFSRIIHVGHRSGDHAGLVILEWTQQSGALVPLKQKLSEKSSIAEETDIADKTGDKIVRRKRKTVAAKKTVRKSRKKLLQKL